MSPSFDFPSFNAGQLISALPSLKKSKRGWEIFKKVSFFVKVILIVVFIWEEEANERKAPPIGGKLCRLIGRANFARLTDFALRWLCANERPWEKIQYSGGGVL